MITRNDSDIRISRLQLGPWDTNAYIVVCPRTGNSVVVDAPADAETIVKQIEGTRPGAILITHSHGDHTGALTELRERLGVPVAAHAADAARLPVRPDRLLNDGDILSCGKIEIQVLHTPGHTPGSLCFRVGKYLLAGDTIFPGGPGHTDSPADLRRIIRSISEKVFTLPEDTVIYPGHGEGTTVEKAKEEYAVFASRPHDPGLCGDVLWV